MKIIFYKFTGDKRNINKVLSSSFELEGVLRDQSNLLVPQIMVKHDIREYNYCYVEEFNRYYYINDIDSYRNGLWVIKLKVDVLMSYKDKILELSGIVSRLNETDYVNASSVFDSRDTHERIDWGDELKLGSYILVAKGGH